MTTPTTVARRGTDPANNSSLVAIYVGAILTLVALTLASIVAILALRPTADNTQIIVTVVGVSAPIILMLMSLIQRENHMAMNSRLDQLLAMSNRESRAEGVIAGTEAERASPMVPNAALPTGAPTEVTIVSTAAPIPVEVVEHPAAGPTPPPLGPSAD